MQSFGSEKRRGTQCIVNTESCVYTRLIINALCLGEILFSVKIPERYWIVSCPQTVF